MNYNLTRSAREHFRVLNVNCGFYNESLKMSTYKSKFFVKNKYLNRKLSFNKNIFRYKIINNSSYISAFNNESSMLQSSYICNYKDLNNFSINKINDKITNEKEFYLNNHHNLTYIVKKDFFINSLSCNLNASLPNRTNSFSINRQILFLHIRNLHTGKCKQKEESKVGETLEKLKENIKKVESINLSLTTCPEKSTPPNVPPVKLPLSKRIINEIKHYYHGFRLLFIDVRICIKLLWSVLNGKTLMRRERQQLVRTTADLFRLVPFLVFIIVPFAEFLLPVVLKFFPGMLPSTFAVENVEIEKRRKRLKLKLEMAKFLQDTIEETSLQRKDARGESIHDFVNFMTNIRNSGAQTSNEEILKFSKLFEDNITLDNLNFAQLRALCQLVDITPVGPSYFLRFQLEMKLRQLEADDKVIQSEGINQMAIWELQDACRQRGMRSFGVPEDRLQSQLHQWLDLHLNMKIPTSLLLLSRTLYFPEHISTEDQLKATILQLPKTLTEETKVKILEVSGDRVDNKSKLEVIKQEEELIQQEKKELEEMQLMNAKKKESILLETLSTNKSSELITDNAKLLDNKLEQELIHSADLEQLEDILEMVANKKQDLKKEVEELKALKEDISEYKENLGELKGVVKSGETPHLGLDESKAAKRLSKKVEKLISKLDESVEELSVDKKAEDKKLGEKQASSYVVDKPYISIDQISTAHTKAEHMDQEKLSDQISVAELLTAMEQLKSTANASKFEIITKVLDEDKDGMIDYKDAMKLIELIGSEKMQINANNLSKIMKLLIKEKELEEGEKLKKQEEKLIVESKDPLNNNTFQQNITDKVILNVKSVKEI